MDKTFNIKSEGQEGGVTSGIVNNNNNKTYIWKGRKEGFFTALGLGIIAEVIIRLIFRS